MFNKNFFISILLLLSFLTACNDNYSKEEQTLKAIADDAGLAGSTITVMASSEWIKNSEMDLGSKFESVTGVEVIYDLYPDDVYLRTLFSRLENNQAPDIFLTQSGLAIQNTYQLDQYALDLSNESWMEYYDPFTAKETSIDGKNYGMTYYDTTTDYYLIYNRKILEKAEIKELPTTFDEFDRMCSKILSAGVIPIYEPMADGWHQAMLFAEISPVFSHLDPDIYNQLNHNETTFAENSNMQLALDQIQSMAMKGYFGSNFSTDTYETAPGYLASGEYAMCMLKPGTIHSIINSDLNNGFQPEDFGIMLLPVCDNQILNIHPTGPSHFINKNSGNLTAARLYLDYIATQENIQYMIDHSNDIENLPFDAGQTAKYDEITSTFLNQYDDEHSGTVLQDEVSYFNEQWGAFSNDILKLCQGEMTSAEVLSAIDARRAELAQYAGDLSWK